MAFRFHGESPTTRPGINAFKMSGYDIFEGGKLQIVQGKLFLLTSHISDVSRISITLLQRHSDATFVFHSYYFLAYSNALFVSHNV